MTPRILAMVVALVALAPFTPADDGEGALLTSDIVISDQEASIDLATDPSTTWEIVVASMNVLGYSVASTDVQNAYGWLTVDDVWVAVGAVPYKPGTWSRVRVRVGSFDDAVTQQRAEVLLVAVASRFDERVRLATAPAPAVEPSPETGNWDVPVYGRGATGGVVSGGGDVIVVEDSQPDVYVNITPPIISTSFALGCGYAGYAWTPAWGFSWNRYAGWSPWISYGHYGYGSAFGYLPCSYPIISTSYYYGCGWSPFAYGCGWNSPWYGPSCWYSPFFYHGFGYHAGFGFYGGLGGLAFGYYHPWWYDDDWYDDWYDHHYDGYQHDAFPNNGRGRLARIAREENALGATAGRDTTSIRESAPRGSRSLDGAPRVSVDGRDADARGRSVASASSRSVMPRIVRTTSRRSTVRVGNTDRLGTDRTTISPIETRGERIGDVTSGSTGRSSVRLPSSPIVVGRTSTSPSRTSSVTVRSRSGVPYYGSTRGTPTTSTSRSSSIYPSTSRSASSYGRSSSSPSITYRSSSSSRSSSSYRSPSTSSRSSSSYSRPSTSSRSSSSYSRPSTSSRSSSSYSRPSTSSRSSISSRSSSRSSSRGSISSRSSSSRSSGRSSSGRSSGGRGRGR